MAESAVVCTNWEGVAESAVVCTNWEGVVECAGSMGITVRVKNGILSLPEDKGSGHILKLSAQELHKNYFVKMFYL